MLNMDFSQRVVIEAAKSEWQPSPAAGIERKLLEREEAERGRATVRINTNTQRWLPGHGGLQVMPLHSFETEHVALVKWPAGEVFQPHRHYAGEEILVLSGEFIDEHGRYPKGTWMRSPHASKHTPHVEQETIIYVKTGHLPVL